MKKFRCTVCGYVYEGDAAPEKCPLCKAPASKFVEVVEVEGGALTFADEHVIGVAKGCDEEMIKDLNNHFMGECTEVGMYLAMSRQGVRLDSHWMIMRLIRNPEDGCLMIRWNICLANICIICRILRISSWILKTEKIIIKNSVPV